jgi:hypothetical protein
MLSPESEDKMMEAFTKLRMQKNVIYTTVKDTLRPRDKKTKKIYDKFYSIADTAMMFNVDNLSTTFPNIIDYKDMTYSPNDAYITHDNLTEDFLYRDKSFTTNPTLELIPKGFLASRPPKDLSSYPVLSQIEAERTHAKAYTQIMNVGSAVRFQGSEVTTDQKLYYLVQPNSLISARELYTVLTRMWSIDSFVIVITDTPTPYELNTFKGLPVKTHKYLALDNKDKITTVMTNKEMDDMLKEYDTDKIYYDRDEVKSTHGGYTRYIRKGVHVEISEEKPKRRTSSAGSLAKRDASLNYSYMDQVYSILDEHELTHVKSIHRLNKRQPASYELDIFSAHPTMLKYEKMPIDGKLEISGPNPDMLNFYVVRNTKGMFTQDAIVTDDLKNYLTENDLCECEYLFSTPYKIGCFPGDWLYKKAHDTVESKKEIKTVHYGYYQKPYLKKSLMGDCYVRYENYIYELLICQVFSQLLYYMLTLYNIVDGKDICVDAVTFECYNEDVLKRIKDALPDYIDFRIRTSKEDIVYQTYETLPTRAQKKVAQRRESRRRKKEVQHE